MALLRRYTSTNNGRLTVLKFLGNDAEENLSDLYQNIWVPAWGLVEAEVEVHEVNGVREYKTRVNGVSAETVMAAGDLLRLVRADEALPNNNPRHL